MSIDETSVEVTYDGTYVLPTPTREGYHFDGWFVGETLYTSGDTVKITSNMTFTAKWTVNQYTITFVDPDGTTIYTIEDDYDSAITEPADPTKTGYTFKGWDKEIPETMPAENVTITAQWEIESYTLNFDSNGGSAVSDITTSYGSTITAPTPTKEGYTFTGWDPAVPETMPDYGKNGEEVTFTAQWEIESYTITFDEAGGSTVADITAKYGEAITSPVDPSKRGYTFAGWDWTVPNAMPDLGANGATKTVTASWTLNIYKITVDLDGGEIDGSASWTGS